MKLHGEIAVTSLWKPGYQRAIGSDCDFGIVLFKKSLKVAMGGAFRDGMLYIWNVLKTSKDPGLQLLVKDSQV